MLKLLSLALVGAVAARVMNSLPGVPTGWKEIRVAESDEPVILRLSLRQQHGEELEQKVLEISTPGHPDYGNHLGLNELKQYTKPSETTSSAVTDWLRKSGIEPSMAHDWMTIASTAGVINKLLDTTLTWYQRDEGDPGGAKLRTLSYSVPDELAWHITMIQPTTRFGQPSRQRSTIVFPSQLKSEASDAKAEFADGAVADCSGSVTPACLKSLYKIAYTASGSANNSVAFASYLEEYARYADLSNFISKYAPQASGQNFTVVEINGGLNNQTSRNDSGEANLDAQYVLGVSHPISMTEYSTAGRGPLVSTEDEPSQYGSSNEPYLEFLVHMLNLPDDQLPQTLSTSYGEEEQSVPQDYAITVCNQFMQLGARGVSVLFSSGDSGPGSSCVRNSDNATFFNPTFPAGCPYVTAVGATSGSGPEKAVTFSSGGFSIYHSRPQYQDAAVSSYLNQLGATYSAYFNASGRGIPDVAAQGEGFVVIDKAENSLLSGTSASCPTFAGVVALLNAARKSQGKSPLGFLNPWLYENSAALTDITSGAGVGCRNSQQATEVFGTNGARWNATGGWDPVTGLGTPLFDKMLEAAAPGVPNA